MSDCQGCDKDHCEVTLTKMPNRMYLYICDDCLGAVDNYWDAKFEASRDE